MIATMKPETEAAIRARAHQMWEDEGRPEGRQELHWKMAHEAIMADLQASAKPALQKSAPAKAAKPKAPAKKK